MILLSVSTLAKIESDVQPAAQHVAAPERLKVVGELQRYSASGELCRYAVVLQW